jgi:hypothetical protein
MLACARLFELAIVIVKSWHQSVKSPASLSLSLSLSVSLSVSVSVSLDLVSALSRFSIGASLARTLFPVSTDVESYSCGICVVSPHSQSFHLSVYFGVYFPKEKKLN